MTAIAEPGTHVVLDEDTITELTPCCEYAILTRTEPGQPPNSRPCAEPALWIVYVTCGAGHSNIHLACSEHARNTKMGHYACPQCSYVDHGPLRSVVIEELR